MPRDRKFRQRLLDALGKHIEYHLGLENLNLNLLKRDVILAKAQLDAHDSYFIEDKIKYYYKDDRLHVIMKLFSSRHSTAYQFWEQVLKYHTDQTSFSWEAPNG